MTVTVVGMAEFSWAWLVQISTGKSLLGRKQGRQLIAELKPSQVRAELLLSPLFTVMYQTISEGMFMSHTNQDLFGPDSVSEIWPCNQGPEKSDIANTKLCILL